MHSHYKRLRIKALSERGKIMAAARWKRDRERREAEMPERLAMLADIEANNLPHREGDLLGTLQWTDQGTGKVRRWQIRIGDRSDRITYTTASGQPAASCGWTHFLTKLRHHLTA